MRATIITNVSPLSLLSIAVPEYYAFQLIHFIVIFADTRIFASCDSQKMYKTTFCAIKKGTRNCSYFQDYNCV